MPSNIWVPLTFHIDNSSQIRKLYRPFTKKKKAILLFSSVGKIFAWLSLILGLAKIWQATRDLLRLKAFPAAKARLGLGGLGQKSGFQQ